ncbi:MAG: adenylosuccinate lyase [Defluviitaleaceae bacterium]|nr:adenylosuccinate lyase [Defluviitaleaceae bacterium]
MIERYSTEEMSLIWSENSKFKSWLKVELYSLEAYEKLGIVSKEDLEYIQKNASFNIDRINELERETRHDVVAFTRAVEEKLGKVGKWIHYGLTSTDVVDTAQAYRLKKANKVILKSLKELEQTLYNKAIEHKYTLTIGRTHGIHAEPTSFGLKFALYVTELRRNIKRFKEASKIIEVGKISGAVGNFANTPIFIEEYVCEKLGIGIEPISTQVVQRDRHADYIATLALIGSSLEKIAVEFRHLQRTELDEVSEGFRAGQTGSSAMPHKRNPIGSENITGLSRILRGYMVTAYENIPLWHERDISHSSAERIILPDSTNLLHYIIKRMNDIVKNLVVNKEQMLKNIDKTNGLIYSQRVLHALIDSGMNREEAYKIVQPFAMRAYENGESYYVLLLENKILPEVELKKCFDNDYYLKNIDELFERMARPKDY